MNKKEAIQIRDKIRSYLQDQADGSTQLTLDRMADDITNIVDEVLSSYEL